MDSLYPNIESNIFMTTLLSKVVPTSKFEKCALDFYKRHIKEETNLVKLFYDIDAQPKGKTIYNSANELKEIIQESIDFYNMNLFESNSIDKTYDIIIISNILEWARNDINKLEQAKENLSKLLSPNGIVICSALLNRPEELRKKEYELFSSNFEVEEHMECKNYLYFKK